MASDWSELRKLLVDPEMDDLATMRIEYLGRVFEIEAPRLKTYVCVEATDVLRGNAFCGKCREQKYKTFGFACAADGSCAIRVCADCLRRLLDESAG